MASLKPDRVCPFCDTLTPPDIDEMCVLLGSPAMNAILPASPALTPVDGLDPIDGATTKNGLCDSIAAACSSSSGGAMCRTRRHRSPASVDGGVAGGAGAEVSSARTD